MRIRYDIKILFLTFNRLRFTKASLKSLEEAKNRNKFQLIILDNHSKDKTRDFLLKHKLKLDYRVFFSDYNLGVDKAMNWFFQSFKADFYGKVDNDTIVPDFWLDNLLDELLRYDLDIIGARHFTFSERAKKNMEIVEKNKYPHISFVGGSGILIRKEFIEKFGLINIPDDMLLNNWTYHQTRAIRQGARISFSPSVFVSLLDFKDHFKKIKKFKKYDEWMEEIRKNSGRRIDF